MNEPKVTYLPIWRRYYDLFIEARLTNTQVGQLVLAMMNYYFRDERPQDLPRILSTMWIFLEKDMDDAKARYMKSVNNGKKGAAKQAQTIAEKKQALANYQV